MLRIDRRKKAPASKLLVVDASVLRAAGSDQAVHPVPAHCRDTLKTILELSHRAAITDAILEEWNRHQSGFARRWRSSMYARGRITRVQAHSCENVHIATRQSPTISENQIAAAAKDMHLVGAARSADRTIISYDNAAKSAFRKLTATTGMIADLLWIDPVADIDPLRDWLTVAAKTQRHWRLGFQGTRP